MVDFLSSLESWLHANQCLELSISPQLNDKLVPAHARKELSSRGIDLDDFSPMSQDEMMAHLE